MKSLLLKLTIAIGCLLIPCQSSAESLTGTVLSVDREKQQIVLQVETENDEKREITIQATGTLPACAETGTTMRAWGAFASQEKSLFDATDLRGPGRWSTHDPTGVHSRLHRYTSSLSKYAGNRQHSRIHRHIH